MLVGWRIADPTLSKTVGEMLSGRGARLYGGRWNSKGKSVVYLSSNLGTATVEILVKLNNKSVLDQYHKLMVTFDESLMLAIDEVDLPATWKDQNMTPITQAIGDDWVDKQESLILRVPSVAVPGEYNYLLNPEHPDRYRLGIGEISVYRMDERLSK